MKEDPRDNPKTETLSEVQTAKSLINDTTALRAFWDGRFNKVYKEVLEDESEMGRHGVLAEFINRLVPSGRVLDAGCGTGILSELLDLNRFEYVGIDISEIALEIAREKRMKPGIRFIPSRIEDYEQDEKFDVIVFNEVLYYLDYQSVLRSTSTLLTGPRLVCISVFDFKEGERLCQWLNKELRISNNVIIENAIKNLRWRILVGHLNF